MRESGVVIALVLSIGAAAADVPVTIDPATEHQIIDGFGANQPQYYYATDYFGGAILDLAFRRSGMGISLLRCDMPLGFEGVEGTAAGNDNGDPDVIDWGGFDTTVLDSLAAVAQGAAARGCEKFVASPWSPPYWMKTNGSEVGGGRLISGMEPELAEYFRAFLTYLSGGTGAVNPPVYFDHITVQNEPEVSPGWWGCQYTPAEITYAMQFVGTMLATDFPSVTMAGADNSNTTQTVAYLSTIMTDPVVEPMVGIYSVHPYNLNNYPGGLSWGNWSNPDARIGTWNSYRSSVESLGYDRRSWVVEHCDHDQVDNPDPARVGWTSALDGATHIHRALVNGGVSAWSYWTLFRYNADQSGNGYGHALWYSEAADANSTLKATGKVSAFTPFYRYVRPGYRRIEATPHDAATDLRVTAFEAPGGAGDGLVIVVINRGTGDVVLDGIIDNDPGGIASLRRCVAAEYDSGGTPLHGVRGGDPVDVVAGSFTATVPAKSVTAFVHEPASAWPTAYFDASVDGLRATVDAAGSSPASIERYEWDFGDGATAEGVTAIHDYAATGSYSIVLTVTEADGGVDTTTQSVPVQGADISGLVLYYRNESGQEPGDTPVGGVTLDLQGETLTDSTTSDPATGSYTFQDLALENITVTPTKAGEINGISSFDSAIVSQFRVGMTVPTPNQEIAADVSGNGGISSYDAALISQLRVGIITRFPVATASGSDYAFVPTARSYLPLDSDRLNEDYLAIVYGDVTGNWGPSGEAAGLEAPKSRPGQGSPGSGMPDGRRPARSTGCSVSLHRAEVSGAKRGILHWAVRAEGCQGMIGLDLDLAFDPDLVAIRRATATESGSPFTVVSNDREGSLRLAMFGPHPLLEDGNLLILEAEVRSSAPGVPQITIRSARANEGQIPVTVRRTPRRHQVVPRRD